MLDQYARANGYSLVMDAEQPVLWAAESVNVTPDMTLLGKVIGGGLPIGAYGGRADLMNLVGPIGPVIRSR